MIVTGFALAAALTLNIAFPSPAFAEIADGKATFELKCAACHEQGGNSLNPMKTLKASRLDEGQIVALVSNGKGQMPSYGPKAPPFARLTESEINSVATYVQEQNELGWPK